MSELKAGVGLSRKWDAREAGREVAETALEKLEGEKPKFFLLFSTIHYEKYGGFQELLNGVWEVLPEGTPLIGGTVAGFMNNYGCFTRGATALTVAYPNMDVAVGIGHDTKKNPRKAVSECAAMIKSNLRHKYRGKLMIDIVSGAKILNLPKMGRVRVVKGSIPSKLLIKLSDISLTKLQYGVGREEEILDALVEEFPDYVIIGGSSMDSNDMIENYQFFNRKVYTNSIVSLAINIDYQVDLNTTYGLKRTNIKFKITKKSGQGRIIEEIEGKPAVDVFLERIAWPYDFIDERIYRRTFFTPFGYWKDGILFPNVIGAFLGKSIGCGYKIEEDEIYLLYASGESLLDAVDENLKKFKGKDIKFAIIVSCAARLETLGKNIFTVRDKLIDFFGEKEFLLIYAGGEDSYSRENGKRHLNESFNVAVVHS